MLTLKVYHASFPGEKDTHRGIEGQSTGLSTNIGLLAHSNVGVACRHLRTSRSDAEKYLVGGEVNVVSSVRIGCYLYLRVCGKM